MAFIYRLNGDWNPIHVDPDFSLIGGFQKPILQGLCIFGIAARIIWDSFCIQDTNGSDLGIKLKKIGSRFTTPIYPGETLVMCMWKKGQQIIFEGRIRERNKIAIIGFAEISVVSKL